MERGSNLQEIPRDLGRSGSGDPGSTMKDTERLRQGGVEASERAGRGSGAVPQAEVTRPERRELGRRARTPQRT